MSIIFLSESADSAEWLARFRPLLPQETLWSDQDAIDPDDIEIALVAQPRPGALAAFPNLKLICSLWAGVDRLLADPALPDVLITRLVDTSLTQAMTETVVAHTLGLHRQLPAYRRQQVRAMWNPLPQPLAPERRIGILGLR